MTDHKMTTYLAPASEAAKLLGVTVQRVHQLTAEGKLTAALKAPGLRGAAFYTLTEIDRLKEERSK